MRLDVQEGGVAETKVRLYVLPQALLMNVVDALEAILYSINFSEFKSKQSFL